MILKIRIIIFTNNTIISNHTCTFIVFIGSNRTYRTKIIRITEPHNNQSIKNTKHFVFGIPTSGNFDKLSGKMFLFSGGILLLSLGFSTYEDKPLEPFSTNYLFVHISFCLLVYIFDLNESLLKEQRAYTIIRASFAQFPSGNGQATPFP